MERREKMLWTLDRAIVFYVSVRHLYFKNMLHNKTKSFYLIYLKKYIYF